MADQTYRHIFGCKNQYRCIMRDWFYNRDFMGTRNSFFLFSFRNSNFSEYHRIWFNYDLFFPLCIFGFIGMVFSFLFTLLYNLSSGMFGGIEFEIDEEKKYEYDNIYGVL